MTLLLQLLLLLLILLMRVLAGGVCGLLRDLRRRRRRAPEIERIIHTAATDAHAHTVASAAVHERRETLKCRAHFGRGQAAETAAEGGRRLHGERSAAQRGGGRGG